MSELLPYAPSPWFTIAILLLVALAPLVGAACCLAGALIYQRALANKPIFPLRPPRPPPVLREESENGKDQPVRRLPSVRT